MKILVIDFTKFQSIILAPSDRFGFYDSDFELVMDFVVENGFHGQLWNSNAQKSQQFDFTGGWNEVESIWSVKPFCRIIFRFFPHLMKHRFNSMIWQCFWPFSFSFFFPVNAVFAPPQHCHVFRSVHQEEPARQRRPALGEPRFQSFDWLSFLFFLTFFFVAAAVCFSFSVPFFHWITEFCFGWVARYRVVVSSFYTVARLKKPFFVLFIVSLRTVIGPFWIDYSVSVFYRLHRCRISKISFLFVQIECSTLFFGTFSFRFRFEEISFTLRCNFLPIFRCTYFTFWSSWSCGLNLKDLSLNRLNEKSILLMWLVRFFSLVRFWTLVCCCFAAFRSGRDFLWNWTVGDFYYVVIHSAIVRARRRRRRPCGRVQLVMEYCGAGSMTDLVKCESPVSSSIHHMPCSSFSLHSLFDSVEDDRLVFFDSFFLGAWNWVRQAQEAMR